MQYSQKTTELMSFHLEVSGSFALNIYNIHYRSNLSAQELDRVVQGGVNAVGHSYMAGEQCMD